MLGGYQLTGMLGVGGMAEVYRALDVKLGREVAVKVLPGALATDPNYVERFRSEARRVAALNHPNVVPIYTFDEEHGLLYLVMPVLTESLRDRIEREHVFSPAEATRVVVQVASALAAAHAQGLVHRDVKPENVLLDSEGKALLTDFGIAREVAFLRQSGAARTLAATGLPVGTPEYMAPEQLRAEAVDHRADIYALGVVLYELLTGTMPHDAQTPYEVAAKVLMAPLMPPSERNPAIWPELEQVVLRALARDPAQRYPDVQTFARALHRVVEQHGEVAGAVPDWAALTQPLESTALAGAVALAAGAGASLPPPLVPEALAGVGGSGGVAAASPRRIPASAAGGRRLLLVAAVVVALAAGAGGASALGVLSGLGLAPFGVASTTHSPTPDAAAMASASAAASATAAALAQPTATTQPTATPQPTATRPPAPTATATALTTAKPNLEITPQPFVLTQNNGTCTGTQTLSNTTTNGQSLDWVWHVSPGLPSGVRYQINSQPATGTSGTPMQGDMPPGSETLSISMPCTGQTYAVSVENTGLTHPVTFLMRVPTASGD